MLSIIGFFIILGPLVIVHELGHYLFARLFNVKAEVFSVGFGPTLWSKKIGETEWKWSAIPMGGYVKLLGEDPEAPLPPELAHRSLQKQAPYKRFFIFFGGPLFNFLWAAVVFMAMMVIGEDHLTSRIARVLPNSDAYQVGLRSGDLVTAVEGQAIQKWEDLVTTVGKFPNQKITLDVERGTERLKISATPKPAEGFGVYGENAKVGEIDGVMEVARSPEVGVSDPKSVAGKLGFKTGDLILSVNGAALKDWESFEALFTQAKSGQALKISFERPANSAASSADGKGTVQKDVREATLVKTQGDSLSQLGLFSSELFIQKTIDKSPAEASGLRSGDRLVSVGGHTIVSFFDLRKQVQDLGAKLGKFNLVWEREGKQTQVEVVPTAAQTRDMLLRKGISYTIGVVPMLTGAAPDTMIERTLNPFVLFYKGFERMIVFSFRNLMSMIKMATGEVSVDSLGGPILIGKLAGESLSRGLIDFLRMMAVFSIGLGVLNILPVPVLDGGHLMLLTLEIIRGKPLSIRQMEVLQQVGLSLILLLMVIVMKNDITRLPFWN